MNTQQRSLGLRPRVGTPTVSAPRGRRRRTLRGRLSRALRILRSEGLPGLWARMLSATLYRRFWIIERDVDGVHPVAAPDGVTMALLDPSEMGDYPARLLGDNPQAVPARLEDGDRCFVTRRAGRIMAVAWCSTKRAVLLDAEWPLEPGVFYIDGVFTVEDARGQNVAPALVAFLIHQMRESGYRRAVAAVAPENRAVLRTQAKVGARIIGKVGYLKLGPRRRYFLARIGRR